jgi:hypothetical protein
MTAIQLVSGFNGFGVHTFLTTIRQFPEFYKNFIFASVVVVDQGVFKGEEGLEEHKKNAEEALKKYVEFARNLGLPADYRFTVGTDVVKTAIELCKDVHKEFPRSMVFTGKLSFQEEKYYHKILHNETAFTIQHDLHFCGIPNLILPIKMD